MNITTHLIAIMSFLFLTMSAHAGTFTLTSQNIAEGKQLSLDHVYNGFGCKGKNQSPHLRWSNPPTGTKSFVITAYDPDAPTGSGWWHWVAFNIPSKVLELKKNASNSGQMPAKSVQIATDYGSKGFGGACPPKGEVHRYIFTVHALNVEKLDLDANASPALVGFMTHVHSIDSAKITAIFTR